MGQARPKSAKTMRSSTRESLATVVTIAGIMENDANDDPDVIRINKMGGAKNDNKTG